MPQMSPLMWLNLYLYSLLMMFLFIVMIYYLMIFFKPMKKELKFMKKMNNYMFKW